MGLKAADISAVLNDTPIEQYYEYFAKGWSFLTALGGLKTGKAQIQLPIRSAGNASAASFAESEDISTTGKQARTLAVGTYSRQKVAFGVDGLVEAIAQNGGVMAVGSLLWDEMELAFEDLFDEINTQLLGDGTGNTGKDAYGIQYHVASTGTWMGLDRSTETYAQAYINNVTGALTKAEIDDVVNNIIYTRKKNFDTVFTGYDQYAAYEDMLGDKKRYVQVSSGRGDEYFSALELMGRPVLAIPGYAAGRMDFVNRSEISVEVLPSNTELTVNEKKGVFKVKPLSTVTDDDNFAAILYLQMIMRNPFATGALTGLT